MIKSLPLATPEQIALTSAIYGVAGYKYTQLVDEEIELGFQDDDLLVQTYKDLAKKCKVMQANLSIYIAFLEGNP